MFGGTGVFAHQTCPFVRFPSKSSGSPTAGSTCGRPHCKFSHEIPETSVPEVSVAPVQRSSSHEFPSLVPDFPLVDHENSTVRPRASSLVGKTVADAVAVSRSQVDGKSETPAIPNLQDSVVALLLNGPIGLPVTVLPPDGEKPTYSSTPAVTESSSSTATSFYYCSSPERVNEMEYDPKSNWSMSGIRTFIAPEPAAAAPVLPVIKEEPGLPDPPAVPSTLRSRLGSNNDSMIALGRKPTTVAAASPKIASYGSIGSAGPGMRQQPVSPGVSGPRGAPGSMALLQKRKLLQSPQGLDNGKPVKKKAKFGRSAEDEEPTAPVEALDVKPVVEKARRDSADQAEIMKQLFGNDDEDDDEMDGMSLPIEMLSKPVIPKGFPKNTEKLLQTMTAAAPQEPVRPVAPVVPRPQPVKKKMAPTPQQQLELRNKALEEQRRKSPGAAGAAVTAGSAATLPETVDKGHKRVAHQVPTVVQSANQMPRVAQIAGRQNLQLAFRQHVLEKFVQLMTKVHPYPTTEETAARALEMEADIAKISFHMQTYRSKVTAQIVILKAAGDEAGAQANVSVSVPKMDAKPVHGAAKAITAPKQEVTVVPSTSQRSYTAIDPKFWSDQDFYSAVRKYLITEDELVVEGYPLVQSKKPGEENRRDSIQLYIAMSGKITPERITATHRTCCRCKKEFTVDFEGNYDRDEECIYHWGKAFSRRISGEGMAAKRNCCADDSSSRGCSVAKCHVADTIPSLSGFVSTQGVKPVKPEQRYGVYAIDCEMIYTVGGMELARVTVVDRQLKCIYDTLVRPKQRIVDCNSRFSGLRIEQFNKDAQGNSKAGIKTIEEVHRDLLGGLINEDTVLIGHSLESDLLAMKFIHRNIVDTSLVFPHKRGRPFKRALRNLMRELLMKIIQEDAGGHNSTEDAAACMELMIFKLRQDRDRRHM